MTTLCYIVMGYCLLKIACIVLEIILNPDNETPEDEDEGS